MSNATPSPGQEQIALCRDCAAVQVPYGNAVTLRQGTLVRITQALGDTYTLQTAHGYMVRIAGHDADALGVTQQARTSKSDKVLDASVDEEAIYNAMRQVFDPEIPVNIVDLGLIYACRIDRSAPPGAKVSIDMTLTAPGCGMGDVLQQDVQHKVMALDGVKAVSVQLVLDPPWAAEMMSEAARLELGVF